MRLSRKIAETLMRRASEGKITPLERAALTWHLEEDAVSRDHALELARFLHEDKTTPSQDARRASALHRAVMEKAANELEKEAWRESEGISRHQRSGSLGMAPALVLAAVTVAMITFLTMPAPDGGIPGSNMGTNGSAASGSTNTLNLPEPEIEKAPPTSSDVPVPVSGEAKVKIEGNLKTTTFSEPGEPLEISPGVSSTAVVQP